MCLPDFVEFRNINKDNPIVGYRNWRIKISNPIDLIGEYQDYIWLPDIGKHEVTESNSGIYAYNNNYNYNYNNNYNNNYISGIIHQYGKVAIHKDGQRSEYCKIITLFTIRKSDAKGPIEFLNWIDKFNSIVESLATKYGANTMHYQDFIEREEKIEVMLKIKHHYSK